MPKQGWAQRRGAAKPGPKPKSARRSALDALARKRQDRTMAQARKATEADARPAAPRQAMSSAADIEAELRRARDSAEFRSYVRKREPGVDLDKLTRAAASNHYAGEEINNLAQDFLYGKSQDAKPFPHRWGDPVVVKGRRGSTFSHYEKMPDGTEKAVVVNRAGEKRKVDLADMQRDTSYGDSSSPSANPPAAPTRANPSVAYDGGYFRVAWKTPGGNERSYAVRPALDNPRSMDTPYSQWAVFEGDETGKRVSPDSDLHFNVVSSVKKSQAATAPPADRPPRANMAAYVEARKAARKGPSAADKRRAEGDGLAMVNRLNGGDAYKPPAPAGPAPHETASSGAKVWHTATPDSSYNSGPKYGKLTGATLEEAARAKYGAGATVEQRPNGGYVIKSPSGRVATRILGTPEEELAARQKGTGGYLYTYSETDPFGRPANNPAGVANRRERAAKQAAADQDYIDKNLGPAPIESGTWESPKGALLTRVQDVDLKQLALMYKAETSGDSGAQSVTWREASAKTRTAYQLGYRNPRVNLDATQSTAVVGPDRPKAAHEALSRLERAKAEGLDVRAALQGGEAERRWKQIQQDAAQYPEYGSAAAAFDRMGSGSPASKPTAPAVRRKTKWSDPSEVELARSAEINARPKAEIPAADRIAVAVKMYGAGSPQHVEIATKFGNIEQQRDAIKARDGALVAKQGKVDFGAPDGVSPRITRENADEVIAAQKANLERETAFYNEKGLGGKFKYAPGSRSAAKQHIATAKRNIEAAERVKAGGAARKAKRGELVVFVGQSSTTFAQGGTKTSPSITIGEVTSVDRLGIVKAFRPVDYLSSDGSAARKMDNAGSEIRNAQQLFISPDQIDIAAAKEYLRSNGYMPFASVDEVKNALRQFRVKPGDAGRAEARKRFG